MPFSFSEQVSSLLFVQIHIVLQIHISSLSVLTFRRGSLAWYLGRRRFRVQVPLLFIYMNFFAQVFDEIDESGLLLTGAGFYFRRGGPIESLFELLRALQDQI